jgi:UDP-N-acetylglucosamine--N-acetylmuramyl-(pentapeptide) pyrophosphoryl-undecaprenol N-acetylglucosamine transferase
LLPIGTAQCLTLCRSRRPDLVLGIGGYTSPPLIVAACLLGIRRALLEPNAYPGMANRALAPLADRVFVTFAETVPFFGVRKTRVVGTPIRREFLEEGGPEVKPQEPTLLVFGGSQGAQSINRAMIGALPKLMAACPGLRVIHQTGERDYEEVAAAYRAIRAGGGPSPVAFDGATGTRTPPVPTDSPRRLQAEVVPFLYDMPRAFRQADLIISRAGATTVAELTACGKPAILIPFPHAIYGHQERNARVLERAGAAQVMLDGVLTGEGLANAVAVLLADRARLAEMGRRSRALGRTDSAEQVVSECRQLVGA